MCHDRRNGCEMPRYGQPVENTVFLAPRYCYHHNLVSLFLFLLVLLSSTTVVDSSIGSSTMSSTFSTISKRNDVLKLFGRRQKGHHRQQVAFIGTSLSNERREIERKEASQSLRGLQPFSSVASCVTSPIRLHRASSTLTRIASTFSNDTPPETMFSTTSTTTATTTTANEFNNNQNNHDTMQDTIFALSSGAGGGQATAVAVVRITGPLAQRALQQLTSKACPPRQATLATLKYQKRVLDQALVLYFPQPHSFTGQDVVELHCHGSRAVLQDVLKVLEHMEFPDSLSSRLRYAEAGEFTSRAFAAGKLDLLQVEALADLLAADTVLQKQQALSQLQGDLSKLYQNWKQELIGALAHAEAIIDFGDDEHLVDDSDEFESEHDDELQKQRVQQSLWGGVTDQVQRLSQSMSTQLQHAQRGEWVRQGFSMAILGRPNAGKSSLFNLLAQDEQAAIVSPVQGTTRDVLSVPLNLGGAKCRLLDTAGLRDETQDMIEQEGMKRAQKAANQADLVMVLMDAAELTGNLQQKNETLRQELERLVPESQVPRDRVILVLNKADLVNQETTEGPFSALDVTRNKDSLTKELAGIYTISCETQAGVNEFVQGLTDHVLSRVMGTPSVDDAANTRPKGEDPLMTRGRHRQHVEAALEALDRFLILQRDGLVTVDMAAEELRLAASELGRLTGAIDVEEVLDQLFSDFCIGK